MVSGNVCMVEGVCELGDVTIEEHEEINRDLCLVEVLQELSCDKMRQVMMEKTALNSKFAVGK